MPSWKKVIISGSAAELSSLFAPSITGSLQGTASFALTASIARTASFVTGSNVFGPYGANSITSASFAVSASRALTSSFVDPLNQTVNITGSLNLTGSMVITGSTTTDLVRITQTGTGNAIVIEDATNPDNTPFIINNVGNVMIGTTSSQGAVTIASNGADGLVLDTDTASNTQSSRLFFKNSGSFTDFSIRNTGQLLVIAAGASASVSSGTGRMFISASGEVAIGTGYNVSAGRGAALQVSGSVNIEEGFAYKQDGYDILYITRGATGTSYDNIIGGVGAASGAINPDQTTAYGYYALAESNGTANTAIGYTAGNNNTGSNQTLVGWNAGADATGGSQTAMGRNAGYANNGTFQVAYGYQAGYQNVGTNQTAIGSAAGYQNTASNQTAIGESAGYRNSGSNQTAIGSNAGDSNTATQQSAVGLQAGYQNTGIAQTALGQQAGQSNIGTNQTVAGYASGFQNSGSFQTAIGANAGRDNKGDLQTATGYEAGRLNKADNQTVSGYEAGYLNTGSNQTAMGFQAGIYNSGSNQVAMGNSAGEGNRGNNQTAIGSQAGYLNTGSNQTTVGSSAGYQNSGSDNTNIGYQAGTYTTGVVINSQSAQSVFLGSQTTAGGGNRSNQIIIGFSASGIGSNSVVLGNSSITTTALRGKVGIGTTTPTYTLQINAGPTASIRLEESGSGGNKRLDLTIDGSATARISANQTAQSLAFDTSGGERLRITKDGDIGINTTTPLGKLTVSGSGGYLSYNDTDAAGNLLLLSGSSDELVRIDVSALSASAGTTLSYGIRGVNDTAFATYGKVTDGFMYASNFVNGLNIINYGEGTKEDYIRFYAGKNADGTTPDLHIQGSGSNKGFIGINKTTPNATLDVSGSTIISGSLTVTGGITGSITASGVFGPFGANSVITSSYAVTASYFNATIQTLGSSIYSTNPAAGPNFNTTSSIFIGEGAGQNATNAYSSSFIGYLAGQNATNANNSTFIGTEAGQAAANANNSTFIGNRAGNSAASANNSTFIGENAGVGASSANNSVFIGDTSGYIATNAANSNFFGNTAGYSATNANASNFFGPFAGTSATNASYSNFFGELAGFNAADADYSNFIGYNAGDRATNASYSNFFGYQAGNMAASASYSNIFGWRAGYTNHVSESIGSNNIIIGTNITLKISQSNAINIGGIIFGTGSYSNVMNNPYSGSVADGRIGIGVVAPRATLDVSGSFHVEGTYKAPAGNTIDSNALIQAGLLYLSNNF